MLNLMENIDKYIPEDGIKNPNQFYHNLSQDLEYLLAHKQRNDLDLDGNPLGDIVHFMSDFLGALHHHGCLHSDGDFSSLKNCQECMDHVFLKLVHTVDTVCEYVVDCRLRRIDNFSQNQWYDSSSVHDEEFTPDPEDEVPYRCADPPKNNQPTQQRRDRVCSPSPSTGSSSQSIRITPAPTTPKRTRKKKKQSSPPTGRRFQQNPPSLIFTKISDRKLFNPDRSHFSNIWSRLCVQAFGSEDNTPPKMSFENVDTIENRRSAITISFHERPKQATLKYFIQRTHNNPWQHINLFNPNHQSEMSPWKQPIPNINKSPWNNFSPAHNRRPPNPRFSPSSSPLKPQPQPTPINEFQRRPPPYKFDLPHQHSTQRRLANLETKLEELLQILSYVWT